MNEGCAFDPKTQGCAPDPPGCETVDTGGPCHTIHQDSTTNSVISNHTLTVSVGLIILITVIVIVMRHRANRPS